MTLLRQPARPFLAALLVLAPFLCAAVDPPALTIDEIESLLKAGVGETVILKQIRATRTRLVLTVEGLLRLKAAGASDALLEALLETPGGDAAEAKERPEAPGTVGPEPKGTGSHIRIYTSENERGETVVHITNLDSAGRRLGGELSEAERARRNVVEPPDRPAPSPPTAYAEPAEPRVEAPVIVNIFQEPPQDTAIIGEPDFYGPGYYGGRYPGLLVGGFHGFVPYRHGHLVRPHRSNFYPPGSYTHYLRYHHNAVSPGRAPVLRVDPYTHGNARTRNRDAFRRR